MAECAALEGWHIGGDFQERSVTFPNGNDSIYGTPRAWSRGQNVNMCEVSVPS